LKPSIPTQVDENRFSLGLVGDVTVGTVHWPVTLVKPEPAMAYPDQFVDGSGTEVAVVA